MGDLAFDTIMVIPPSSSADRYVFFPRGPIFYGVDEFTVTEPSFIVQIDNSDVSLEATLIDKSQTLQIGELSANQLVQQALNAGQSARDAEDAKLISMTDSLRKFRLTLLPNEVAQLVQKGNTNGALQLIASFERTFGEDKSGLIDHIKARNGLGETNITFDLQPVPDFVLSENTTSPTFKLTVSNPEKLALDSSLTASSTNSDLIPTNSIIFGGTNANRSVVIQPAKDKYGRSKISLALSSGGVRKEVSFIVDVLPAPSFSFTTNTVDLAKDKAADVFYSSHDLDGIVSVSWSASTNNIIGSIPLKEAGILSVLGTNAGTAVTTVSLATAVTNASSKITLNVKLP